MADKTIKVMVSSTVRDLHEHRQHVISACLRQDMLPKMMEHLGASDDGGLVESIRLVDQADVYIAVVAHRYGTVPKGKSKSITEYEYDRATERGIPRLVFFMHDDHPIKAGDVEHGEGKQKLERFKAKLSNRHTINWFRSPEELRGCVVNSLSNLDASTLSGKQGNTDSTAADRSDLRATLSINISVPLLERVGCPCLELKLVNEGQKSSRITSASLHVCGPHVLAAMQRAFSTDFGYDPRDVELVEQPSFYLSFLPTTQPDAASGWLIEQGDFRGFLLPVADGSLLYFAEAPPDSVYLSVEHADGRHEKLLEGIDVQREIPDLIQMCIDRRYELKHGIILPWGVSVRAFQRPETPPSGFTNDQPFVLPPHPDTDRPVSPESDRIRMRAKILRAGAALDLSSEESLIDIIRGSGDRDVRRDAIVSLRRLATRNARTVFLELLRSETNETTREMVIRSFCLVGTHADISLMERLAAKETSRFCREAAIAAAQLVRHRGPKSKPDAGCGQKVEGS